MSSLSFFRLFRPLIWSLDPETAHRVTIALLRTGLARWGAEPRDSILRCRVWDLEFPNPLGLAAGFDKNAEVPVELLRLGLGFVEIGTVTPKPQDGNPKPRVFRLLEDRALINRLGFNSAGLEGVEPRLRGARARAGDGIIGVNLGRNRDSKDTEGDYVAGVRALAGLADYLVINVSSPNTPGLRALQDRPRLEALIAAVQEALAESEDGRRPPLLLKIAPDLTEADEADIAEVALERGLDGLIVSNTTIARPESLRSPQRTEQGGLSGKPLFEPSTAVLGRMYGLTEGRLPIVGVGGVSSGADAYAKIRAGASLVQLYSALVFEGPGLIGHILKDLAGLLRRDGFESVSEAVGAGQR